MKPTQAQIEASTTAVMDEIVCKLCAWIDMKTKRTCRVDIGQQCLCKRIAIAALTAAAEVGDVQMFDRALEKALVADNTRLRTELAATIECCAQRCDQLAHVELCADDTIRGCVNARPYQVAAAAIRSQLQVLATAAEVGETECNAQRCQERNAAYEGDIKQLEDELETQRNSQVSAVDQMLAAEQREAATIERCAQKIREILKDEYGAERLNEIAATIREMKD